MVLNMNLTNQQFVKRVKKLAALWHVYANPHEPWLCPVLELARYVLCYQEVLRGGSPLFEGTNQYRRYNTRFANLVSECTSAKLKNMGFD